MKDFLVCKALLLVSILSAVDFDDVVNLSKMATCGLVIISLYRGVAGEAGCFREDLYSDHLRQVSLYFYASIYAHTVCICRLHRDTSAWPCCFK